MKIAVLLILAITSTPALAGKKTGEKAGWKKKGFKITRLPSPVYYPPAPAVVVQPAPERPHEKLLAALSQAYGAQRQKIRELMESGQRTSELEAFLKALDASEMNEKARISQIAYEYDSKNLSVEARGKELAQLSKKLEELSMEFNRRAQGDMNARESTRMDPNQLLDLRQTLERTLVLLDTNEMNHRNRDRIRNFQLAVLFFFSPPVLALSAIASLHSTPLALILGILAIAPPMAEVLIHKAFPIDTVGKETERRNAEVLVLWRNVIAKELHEISSLTGLYAHATAASVCEADLVRYRVSAAGNLGETLEPPEDAALFEENVDGRKL